MEDDSKSFLGTGWSFPPSFDRIDHSVAMVSEADDIEESIRIILSTTPGERIMQPEFGCNLKRLVFERVDSTLTGNLNHFIYHALLDFEPRINFLSASIVQRNELDGVLHILIDYNIIITNTRHNLVYPFYILEGTNISDQYTNS
jgi:uncharacterized protein